MIKKIRIRGYRIHRDLTIYPNQKLNLIVGGNEAGKSTLSEAIVLALTGRINGRSAAEELNPYWFNAATPTSNRPTATPSRQSTALSGVDCGRCCESRNADRVRADV